MKKKLIPLLAIIVSIWTINSEAATLVWTNTLGGNWSDATSWDPNSVPSSTDDAVITNTGTYLVTMDVSPIINSLILGGSSGQQTLAVAGNNFTLNDTSTVKAHGILELNGGVLGGSGLLTLQGELDWTAGRIGNDSVLTVATNGLLQVNVANSGQNLDFSGVLTNNGTITLTNGGIRCIVFGSYSGGYGLLVNGAGGLIDLQTNSDVDFYNDNTGIGTPAVINYGVIRKSDGNDTALINTPFFNLGTLDVQVGTISLNGGGNGNGIYQAEPNATLLYPVDYEIDGTIAGNGTNLLQDGILTFDGNITGQFVWSGGKIGANSVGSIAANGLMRVDSGGPDLNLDFYGVLTNNGTITLTNGGIRCIVYSGGSGGYGLLVNGAGGLIDLQTGSDIDFYNDNSGIGTPAVINYGIIRKSDGNDTALINAPFFNLATLDVQVGTVTLNGGGSGNGLFQAEAGTTLAFANDYEMDSALTGAGTNVMSNGIFTLNGALRSSYVVLNGAILEGTNGIIATKLDWTAGRIGNGSVLTVATNGWLRVDLANPGLNLDFYGVLTNNGTITLTNGGIRCIVYSGGNGGYGLLVNGAGGLIDLQTNSDVDFYNDNTGIGTPAVINYGIIRKSDGHDTALINTPFFNLGTLDAQVGVINLNNTYDLTGGTLNFGLNSPTDFGQINLSGAATLAGTLSANANNGYVPIRGNSFAVLTYGSESGNFDNLILPAREAWSTNYDVTTFTLTVLNSAPALPVITNQVINEETTLNVTNIAIDLDLPPDIFTYSLLNAPAGAAISPVGIITWTPNESQGPGTNIIVTRVADNGSPSLSATNSFTLVVNEVNVAPVLPTQADRVINELTLLAVTNTATDHDLPANPLTYNLQSAPAGAVIDANGVVTWTPTEAQGPSTNVFVTVVTDTNIYAVNAKSFSVTNSFMVTVNEVNTAPILTMPANAKIDELTSYSATVTAADFDLPANPLTFALVSGPSGLTVSPAGVINWLPTEAQGPSTNTITVSVADLNTFSVNAKSLSVTNSFQIVVNELNTAPVLAAINDRTVNSGQTISFVVTATDTDAPTNTLTFSLVSPPVGATLDSGSGQFAWRPSVNQAGSTNTMQVQVTDANPYAVNSQHLTDTKSFTVIVNPLAPVTLTSPTYADGQFTFQVNGTTGPDYIILAGTNLLEWNSIFTNLSPTTPFQFTNNATSTNRFYRVRLTP